MEIWRVMFGFVIGKYESYLEVVCELRGEGWFFEVSKEYKGWGIFLIIIVF